MMDQWVLLDLNLNLDYQNVSVFRTYSQCGICNRHRLPTLPSPIKYTYIQIRLQKLMSYEVQLAETDLRIK
jgi:hypothetical protein